MKDNHIYAIRIAVENQIENFRNFAQIRDNENDEESRNLFLQEALELQQALTAFLEENPT